MGDLTSEGGMSTADERGTGIPLIAGLFLAAGDMCPKCAWGTRKTSKRWARCKKCGMRVRRRTEDEAVAMVKRCAVEASDA